MIFIEFDLVGEKLDENYQVSTEANVALKNMFTEFFSL